MEHTIELDGEAKVLRYDAARSRTLIQRLTEKDLLKALDSNLIEDQAALIVAGLPEAHRKEPLSDGQAARLVETMIERFDAMREADQDFMELIRTARRAIGASGICGFRFDVDERGVITDVRRLGKGMVPPT